MVTTPEAYVHLSTDKTILTFYYDTLRTDRNGTTWGIWDRNSFSFCPAWAGGGWRSPNTTVLTAVFDASFRDFRPTTTTGWFYKLTSLKSIEGLEHLNTSQVTDMGGMFLGCESLAALDLSSFDTSQVTDMSYMFCGCSALTSLDVSHFDTSQVEWMRGLFEGCSSLTALDLSNFDTSMLGEMDEMFSGCTALTTLDLSNFDTSWVDYMYQMFCGCNSLTTIYCNSSWSARHSDDMFSGCNSLRGAATNVGNSYDVNMANPETGYFTKKVLS